jgi:hypothetical protein
MDPDAVLGKGTTRVAIDERSVRIRHQITVSIRLGKTVFVAEARRPAAGNSPTREKPEDVSCICSLDDVNGSDLAVEVVECRDLAIGQQSRARSLAWQSARIALSTVMEDEGKLVTAPAGASSTLKRSTGAFHPAARDRLRSLSGVRPARNRTVPPCEKGEELVGREGVEPSTSRLSGVRSNHLSYRPSLEGTSAPGIWWSLSGSNR